MIYAVYEIRWTEYERGWGQRPDGVSLHKSLQDALETLKKHNAEQPTDHIPDIYTKGSDPKLIEVDKKTFDKVQKKPVYL